MAIYDILSSSVFIKWQTLLRLCSRVLLERGKGPAAIAKARQTQNLTEKKPQQFFEKSKQANPIQLFSIQ